MDKRYFFIWIKDTFLKNNQYLDYLNQKKELYNAVSQMMENQDIDMYEYDQIYKIIQSQKILES